MALGDPYATLTEMRAYLGADDTKDDAKITDALNSVSREIEKYCGRQFNLAGVATARIYYPDSRWLAKTDDFATVTGLVIAVDSNNDGVYETTWTSADYQLEPLNNVVEGESGWPYNTIRAVSTQTFPTAGMANSRAPLQVTAAWGWTAVPSPVKQACLILGAETFKLKGAPFGVAGMDQFGPIRVRDNPMAAKKLAPYTQQPVLMA